MTHPPTSRSRPPPTAPPDLLLDRHRTRRRRPTRTGAVALARTGIPADGDLTSPEVTVGWLHHTPLLAFGHLLVGAGLLSTGWYAAMDARPSFLALLAIIFGLVVWIEPDALHPALGTHRVHGITYLTVGVAHLTAGLLAADRLPSRRDPPPAQRA